MYADEPWDALELAVLAALFGGHPYGRPVLGTADELRRLGAEELAELHFSYYGPDNAVLVVAGELQSTAEERVTEAFSAIAPRSRARPTIAASPLSPCIGSSARRDCAALLALPAPATDEDHAALRLLAGARLVRASRLQRRWSRRHLCLGVNVNLADSAGDGFFVVAAGGCSRGRAGAVEALPPSSPGARGAARPRRARPRRQVLLADWAIGHERIHQQALAPAPPRALTSSPGRSLAAPRARPRQLLAVAADASTRSAARASDGPAMALTRPALRTD
jgi:hypothetical protein